MDGAVLEVCDARTEDEIRRSFDIAIQVIVALDSAVLAETAVGIQGILVSDELAAVEEQEIPVREDGDGLADLLALARDLLCGIVTCSR